VIFLLFQLRTHRPVNFASILRKRVLGHHCFIIDDFRVFKNKKLNCFERSGIFEVFYSKQTDLLYWWVKCVPQNCIEITKNLNRVGSNPLKNLVLTFCEFFLHFFTFRKYIVILAFLIIQNTLKDMKWWKW
jgi:hypothetical protein